MLNFHIRKVTLKNKELRYRAVITRSGKSVKSKTFRRKANAATRDRRTTIEYQSNGATGTLLAISPFHGFVMNISMLGQAKTMTG